MVKSRLLVTGILVVLFFFIVVPQGTAAQGKDRGKKDGKKAAEFIPGEILVKFKPGVSSLVRQKVHDKFKAKVVKRSTKLGIERVKLPAGAKIAEILEQYRRNSNVEFAEPNYIFHADWTPDDPGYPDQWGLPKINTPQAWDITRGSTTVKVAVVDTGVDLNHPDLQANLVGGYNAINGGSAQDDNGHGTHVAGIIAAVTNNGIGVAGVAPQVKIIPVKVLDANGSGYLSDVAEGIRWAADNGADVINLSLGASVDTYTMREAINYAYNKGVVIVAAAGNDYRGTVNYPAANDHVIGVSATDSEDFLAYFSNIGPQVDVAAPGLNILSTYWYQSSSTYAFLDGTSMATPFVAGLAALIRSQNDSLTPDQVEGKIKAAAVDLGAPGKDDVYGYGRIDAYRALGNPPPGDVWEDNDTAGQAPLLNDGITLNPTFYPAGDQDWFKINTSTGKLVIDVLPSSEADAIVEVYDSGLSLVGQADTTGSGGREHLSLSGLSSGNYYLKIYEAGGNSFSNPYTLAVSTVGDGQENNNVALMASAVTSGQTIYPTLNPAGDEDWFSIYAHEPGDLTVSVQPPSNMDAAIRIYDSNLNRLTTIDSYYEGGSESGTVSLLQGGTYYIQVYDYFNAQSNGSYAFTATYTDTTKPVISNVSDGPDPFLAAHNASNISFTLSEEAFVTVKIYAGSTLVKTLLNNSLRGAGSHSVSWDGTNNLGYRLPDGLYTYKINATDLAGNVADEVSGTIYLDKSIPEISNLRVTPSIFSPVIGDATINYELSEESLVSLIVEDLSGNPVRVLLDNVRQAAGSQNAYWDGNNDSGGRVSDGEYILRVEAVDLRGNPSDAVNASVVVDGTPPGVESIYPADGATSISLNSSIKVIFSEEIDISSLNVSTFTLFAAGTPVSGLVSYDAALKQAVFTPFTSLEENTWYSVVLDGVIKDLAGNSLGQPYTWSFRTADLTSPQTAVVSPVEGSALKDQVTLKASVRDGGGIKEVYFEYSADGSNWMTLPGTAVLREGTVLEGLWEYTWEVTGLPENVYIRVKAIDLGGNTGYSQPVFYQVLQSNEVMVDTGGGEYNFEQGQVKLIIPPDAFASQTRIRVSKVDQNGTVAPPSGYRLVGAVYDFTAETEFNSPVTVVFKYNPEELGDAVEEALKVYYLKPTTNKWEPVGGKVNTVTHTVTVELEHFSQYALLAPEKRYYLATPTRDVYGNSYFNPDNFTNYPYEIYLPNETDPASYRIHTSYTRDTDACAS
ncbi:S8 family serine peptidase, partial [Calderihabitans maritimus]